MALASDYDKSRFLRAEDVPQDRKLRIKSVTEEEIGLGADRSRKLVVWFDGEDQGLVLNKTNIRTLRKSYGDDTADWVGQSVVLFSTDAEWRGQPCRALRVRTTSVEVASSSADAVRSRPLPANFFDAFDRARRRRRLIRADDQAVASDD
jgi:hypothetical protein